MRLSPAVPSGLGNLEVSYHLRELLQSRASRWPLDHVYRDRAKLNPSSRLFRLSRGWFFRISPGCHARCHQALVAPPMPFVEMVADPFNNDPIGRKSFICFQQGTHTFPIKRIQRLDKECQDPARIEHGSIERREPSKSLLNLLEECRRIPLFLGALDPVHELPLRQPKRVIVPVPL